MTEIKFECENVDDNNRVIVCYNSMKYHYWAPPNGGYVRIETKQNPGCLGKQITWKGGSAVEWDGKSSFKELIKKYWEKNEQNIL